MPSGVSTWDVVAAVLTTAVLCIPLAISGWAFLDAARRPSWAWALANRNQAAWMAMVAVGVLSVIGGLVVAGIYLVRIRPDVAAAEDGRIAG
jgi:hypothetical protein